MSKPLILIPPSEGKSSGGEGLPWSETDHFFKDLQRPRHEVIKALKTSMKEPELNRSKLLGVKGKKVGEATRRILLLISQRQCRLLNVIRAFFTMP